MRLLSVIIVALAASCSLWSSTSTPDAHAPDAPVDACALVSLPGYCVTNGFDTLSPDGAWHRMGSSTSTVISGVGSQGSSMTTMGTIDDQVFIQRYGCVAGFGSSAMPPADLRFVVSATGISFKCDHAPGCSRGAASWSVCVNGDGQLVYEASSYMTSTMPGAYETSDSATAVLTR